MLSDHVLLKIKQLKKYFPVRKGLLRRISGYVRAVDDINFDINERETLGLVGESGCGKTTAGRTIVKLLKPTSGCVTYHSRDDSFEKNGTTKIDVTTASKEKLKYLRSKMQIIFQDPYSSLNPRMSVGKIVGEPLQVYGRVNGSELEDKVIQILGAVGLKSDHMKRYPHEFSGGQRQRISIARALVLEPQFIVADEPISALDVSIQAQVLNLLEELQNRFGLTYLFIAHDLSVVRYISDRVAVMYLGKIVEMAPSEKIFSDPKHPYTEALISAVPVPDPDYKVKRILLKGDVPSPVNPPSGCYFHTRCQYADDMCQNEDPVYRNIDNDHCVSCHQADKLFLKPIQGS